MQAAPADTPDQICTKTEDILPDAQEILQKIQSAIETLGGWLLEGFKLIDGFIGTSVASALDKALADFQAFLDQLGKMVQKIYEIIEGIAMPWILPGYAEKWTEISNRMGTISEILGPEALRAPGAQEWTGQAAQRYQDLAAKYVETALYGRNIAYSQSALIQESAYQAQSLYFTILGLIIAIIASIALASVEAGTIVGIPAAIITLIAESFPLSESIINAVIELLMFVKQQVEAFMQIKGSLEAATHVFPNNAWPPVSS